MPVEGDAMPHLRSPVQIGVDRLAHEGLQGCRALLRHLVETDHVTIIARQGGGHLGGKGVDRELHARKLRSAHTL